MVKSNFLNEFKAFAMKGNVIDMAVGVIIGSAFGKIVSSLVADIVMPLLGVVIGGIDLKHLKWVIKDATTNPDGTALTPEVSVNYGVFLQNTIDFLIIAFSIFLVIKLLSQFKKKKEETAPAPAPPQPTKEEMLLTEIRDLLKEQNKK